MLNRCDFIGNLGADPETRTFSNGNKVCNLRLAVSETWRDKESGDKKERTEWVQVAIFNELLAKIAEQFLRKGSRVYISGQMETRKWQDQSGADRYSTEIVLRQYRGELKLLDPREGGNMDSGNRDDAKRSEPQRGSPPDGGRSEMDDEIPFMMEWR